MKPMLKIDDTDFTEYVEEMQPSNNDLDADGSGRDIYTGLMYRTKITDKDKLEVTMLRIWEDTMKSLRAALKPAYVDVTFLDPATNTQSTKEMYCSSITDGIQMYDKSRGKTYYEGATFSLTER
ncbi:MAG: hypothetical protein LIP12_17750 [Clostridiales bacterium]|nr:hypothetical protein [Clostridiales bacterium]